MKRYTGEASETTSPMLPQVSDLPGFWPCKKKKKKLTSKPSEH